MFAMAGSGNVDYISERKYDLGIHLGRDSQLARSSSGGESNGDADGELFLILLHIHVGN